MTIVPFLQQVSGLILNPIILLLFALSFLYFVYGVFKYLSVDASDTGGKREEARDAIIWGIVGMVIMFSVYGIINFILTSFGIPSPSNLSSVL
jgi:hypothetical protein